MWEFGHLPNSLRRAFFGIIAVSFIAGAISGALFGVLGAALVSSMLTERSIFTLPAARGTISALVREASVEEVVRRVNPAIVSVVITKNVSTIQSSPFSNDPFGNNFFNFFGIPVPRQQREQAPSQPQEVGGGSGFFVSSNGLIVTNKHVVADEQATYTVITNGSKRYEAKVLARDSVTDLAILKIEGHDFPTLPLGDSSSLQLGQAVIAIGNALGEFSNTVSTGVVSGLSRSITAGGSLLGFEQLSGVIQTDAAINPGNSGGPLLNLKGEVIGINTAIAQNAQNIGFAIPINEAKQVITSVEKTGRIVRPFLGVRYVIITSDLAKEKQLPVEYGALIVRGQTEADSAVTPGSPADRAGIEENDIILEVNGKKVTTEQPLANLVAGFSVGDTITLKVLHKGDEKEIKVVLTERK